MPLRRPDCTLSRLHFLLLWLHEYDRPVTQSIATPEPGFPGHHLGSSGTVRLAKALDVSPHPGADGLVQGERGGPVPWIVTVFTSLACYPGALPTAAVKTAVVRDRDRWGLSPVPRGGHLPSRAARSSLLFRASHWRSLPPTGRYHDVHSAFPTCVCHTAQEGVCTHAGSGPWTPSPWPAAWCACSSRSS